MPARRSPAAERGDLEGRGVAKCRLLAHHGSSERYRGQQAEQDAGHRRMPCPGSGDPDHDDPCERNGHPGQHTRRETFLQPPAAQESDDDRAKADDYCRCAGIDFLLAPVQSDHVDAEPEHA